MGVLVDHQHGGLHRLAGRTDKVVRVAAGRVAVDGALAARVAGVEDFKEVELAAARGPAGTVGRAILQRAWDLRIEHPDGRHIGVGATGGGVKGHLELEEEELLRAAETVVGDGAVARVTAACFGADCVGHDDDFRVGGDDDVGEDCVGSGTSYTIGRGVGEGASEFTVVFC